MASTLGTCTIALMFATVGLSPAMAGEFNSAIDMTAKGGTTFYVPGRIAGVGAVDLMVDTGSGYMTINERMLERLQQSGEVRFVRHMRGRLANGSELEVPLYSIGAVSIGESCWLNDVEAAVFPGDTRPILGLNVLQRAAPFIFSFEPPQLVLSHCQDAPAAPLSPLARNAQTPR
ncbi:MAG: TIGR02281 family clan AA aspartic protease [Rhodocyclaceae bacterium]